MYLTRTTCEMMEKEISRKKYPAQTRLQYPVVTSCYSCDKPIEGKWDSTIQLAIEMGELEGEAKSRFFFRDKCIKCSPSRAQHIVHSEFPTVKDDREQYNKMFWDKYERSKYEKLYTNAWIRLQERYNPKWANKKN